MRQPIVDHIEEHAAVRDADASKSRLHLVCGRVGTNILEGETEGDPDATEVVPDF